MLFWTAYQVGTWGRHATTPINAHIARMQPRWEEFKRTNSGFEFVLFWERKDGTLGIGAVVTSQVQVDTLVQFVAGTHPAWPLWTNEIRVDPGQYQNMMDAPARAQAARSLGWQTPARPGSGR